MRDLLAAWRANPSLSDGATVTLAAGLDLTAISGIDWAGSFVWDAAREPAVIESADPDNPAILRNVTLRAVNPGDGSIVGNVEFKNLRFDYTNIALLDPEFDNDQTSVINVEGNNGNEIRDVTLRNNLFIGSFPDGRVDNRDAAKRIVGFSVAWTTNFQVIGNRFTAMSSGGVIAGTGPVIRSNDFDRNWEDFLRISSQNQNGTRASTTDPVVENNVVHDWVSRNRLHPDFLQIDRYFSGTGTADIVRPVIRGNIVFTGVAQECGAYPGGYGQSSAIMIDTLPATLTPAESKVYRVRDYSTATMALDLTNVSLPAGNSRSGMAVMIEATDQAVGTLTLEPAAGWTMTIEAGGSLPSGSTISGYDLTEPCMTLEITRESATEIRARPKTPDNNMIQSNYDPIDGVGADDGNIIDAVVEDNIFWSSGANGVIGGANWIGDNTRFTRNSLLRPMSGDRNGDGTPNGHADGLWFGAPAPKVVVNASSTVVATANIADTINDNNGLGSNNLSLNYGDPATFVTLFPGAVVELGEVKHNPSTLTEALSLARPADGSSIDTNGQGAVGPTAADDTHDWSWVATFEAGPRAA